MKNQIILGTLAAAFAFLPQIGIVLAANESSPDKNGFEISFDVDLTGATDGEVLYKAGDFITVSLRDAKKNPAPNNYDEIHGNYLNFPLTNDECIVLEALMSGATGRIGIPLGALENPSGKHHVRIVNNSVYYTIDVDDRRDENFPISTIRWPENVKGNALSKRITAYTLKLGIKPGTVPRPNDFRRLDDFRAQYWTPQDHNQWVGDVVTTVWDGKLHIFYLVDRRHHSSKHYRGGHWFEHIVSEDLVHWRELPTAVPMERNWEYIGTGTPFMMDGKYCLAYGLHSTRHGSLEEIRKQGIPFGGTYATSTDGIHFTKSEEIVTEDQNPSIFNRPDGIFGMGGVMWLAKSQTIHGPWEKYVTGAPAIGDCPCPFEWNGWHYIIQGFCTMAKSRTGENGTYVDEVLGGYDPYEGLSVPMVASWHNNRRLLIGWINHYYGWGGWLCFRELVQEPDGCLGTKWVPEIPMPTEPKTYRLQPGEALKLEFAAQDGSGHDFAFVIDSKNQKAYFSEKANNGEYPDVPTYKAIIENNGARNPGNRRWSKDKYKPYDAGDFAIGCLRGLDQPIDVKIVNWFDKKSGMTLVDVEIGGRRTMVTRRRGRYAIR